MPKRSSDSATSKSSAMSSRDEVLSTRVSVDFLKRVDRYRRSKKLTRSDVLNAALSRFFDSENDIETITAKQLARQDRRLRLLDEKLSALADMHLLSQRYFFAYHRSYVSDTERQQAQRSSKEQYARYRDVLKDFMRNGGLFQELNSILRDPHDSDLGNNSKEEE